MLGTVESLNVSVAAGICLAEPVANVVISRESPVNHIIVGSCSKRHQKKDRPFDEG